MDKALKQRMVGAVVLIALGVIFIPMLLDGDSEEEGRTVELDIPAPPERDYRSRLLPLEESDDAEPQASDGRAGRQSTETRAAEDRATRAAAADAEPRSAEPAPAAASQPAESTEEAAAEPTAPTEEAPEPRAQAPLGNWFVQVGSFSQQANAQDLRDRLRGAGYTAFMETSTVEGKTTHRVKVGPEMDRARSERVRDEIQSKFDLKGIVVSEP